MRNWQKKYYLIPSERDKRGRVQDERIKRRQAWIQSLHRSDLTDTKIKYMRICSDHFVSGKPAVFGDSNNPDYVPHVNMGYQTCKSSPRSAARRHIRIRTQELNKLKLASKKILENAVEIEIPAIQSSVKLEDTAINLVDTINETCSHRAVQTDINHEIMENYEKLLLERKYLNEQIYESRNKIKALLITEAAFEGNNKKTRYYTGLPTFTALMKIFHLVERDIDNIATLSKFQQFVLTLMRLRLDLMLSDLAYRFDVSVQMVSRIFYKCLNVMYKYLRHFIIWPDREDFITSMPKCFQAHFGNKVTVIIDCFEVRIERSKNLRAQAATWSNYKHHNTVKILIGICPQGTISFISKAYSGRNSDKMITEKCGILEQLLPGDLVLANRGFLIKQSARMRLDEVKTPASLKNRTQLQPSANVRIHVEKVIGAVRRKYRILFNLLPLSTVKKTNVQLKIPVIDQILTVTCALTNLCPSVIT